MNAEKTIDQLQAEIAQALHHLRTSQSELPDQLKPLARLAPPPGTQAEVSLRHAHSQRQVKRTAPAGAWSPESGVVSISYRPAGAEEAVTSETAVAKVAACDEPGLPKPPEPAEDPVRDLVLALARAEQDPQLGFVSLTWFRDTYLPRQGYAWTATREHRQRVLVEAINRRWVLTSKVPNPKKPDFPVTAVRVNRPLAEVRRILHQAAGFGAPFAPITIPGEPLSETVLRQRR